ncbi:metal-dependent hydrolase family protein (plasmid) [Coraliomargarita sp. W4R53]
MTMTLPGIRVWNGERDLGVCDVGWHGDQLDALASSNRERDSSLSVIPGLIDTHVHLIGNASTEPADFLGWPVVTRPEEQVLHGLSHAQTALRAGTTTLRDLAADHIQFSLKRALDAGVVEGPRLFAGGIVSMTGGHGDMFTPVGVEVRRATADGPWACRALVRTWARAGATSIKIATSGGVLSADQTTWRNHTDEEIAAIVDEAHALGLTVAAHAHTANGIARALFHGVDSLEHATQLDAAMFAQIVSKSITVAPTLLINDRIASGAVPVSAQQSAKAAEVIAARDTAMRSAADAGVEFVLGTDANGFHVGFGDQMAEVRRMSEVLGYSAERALQAATSRAARVLRAEDRIGTFDAGYAADFVIMRGRPWEDISVLHRDNVVAVVSRGRLVAGQLAL